MLSLIWIPNLIPKPYPHPTPSLQTKPEEAQGIHMRFILTVPAQGIDPGTAQVCKTCPGDNSQHLHLGRCDFGNGDSLLWACPIVSECLAAFLTSTHTLLTHTSGTNKMPVDTTKGSLWNDLCVLPLRNISSILCYELVNSILTTVLEECTIVQSVWCIDEPRDTPRD